jgi:uncharacterized protein
MSTPKEIVIAAWKSFATRDEEFIASHFCPDAQWIAPHGNATAAAFGVTDAPQGARGIAHFIATDFPRLFVANVQREIRSLTAEGNVVTIESRLQGTLVNGRHYDNDYCFVFEVRDGKAAVMREYMDTQKGARCIFGDEPARKIV